MNFEFATAGRILFGSGTSKQVGKLAAELGRKTILVTGLGDRQVTPLLEQLSHDGVEAVQFFVRSEPTTDLVSQGVELERSGKCDMVVGFGGGSAIDTAKGIAAMAVNPGGIAEYLEVVGLGKPLHNPCLPVIAIPTTAGTGSEVTRNAVLGARVPGIENQSVKVSLRDPTMLLELR